MLDGALRVLAADGLFPLTALITAAFLTRRLGQDNYGLLTLTVTLAAAVQSTISGFYGRAAIHHVSQATDWVPVGRTVLRGQFLVTLMAGIAFALLATPVARILEQPELVPFLRLVAIDIPLFGIVVAHRYVLTGLGRYRRQAKGMAARWIARLIFIVLFVELGLSVHGAILGLIMASVVELILVQRYVRLPIFGRSTFRIRDMAGTIAPLFVFSFLMRIFAFSDLVLLKMLGGTIGQVGVYGAASNLAVPLGLVAGVVAPVLSSGLSSSVADGDLSGAKQLARNSLRAALTLFPFVALLCGAAPALVSLLFGRDFADASSLFGLLAIAAVLRVLIQTASVVLTAAEKPQLCVWMGAVTVVAAVVGHLVLIPRMGPMGAAVSTLLATTGGAAIALALTCRVWQVTLPVPTVLRCGLLGVVGYLMPQLFPVDGAWVVLQIPVCAVLLFVFLLASGEFSREELVFLRSVASHSPEHDESDPA